jgi:hypothetical protein
MKLPGSADAIVELSKLRDYCLDPHHPRGRHKARVFLSAVGLAQTDAELLRAALIQAACEADAVAVYRMNTAIVTLSISSSIERTGAP